MTTQSGYSMKVAARRSGVSPHVIRIWERRYAAVQPGRTTTGHRVYTDADIERLRLLGKASTAGHSIGRIAQLSTEELRALVQDEQDRVSSATTPAADPTAGIPAWPVDLQGAAEALAACITAVEAMNAETLDIALMRSVVAIGQRATLENVVMPLMQRIGEYWQDGTFRVAQEHIASAMVRTFLGHLLGRGGTDPAAPRLVVATPAGNLHELGALLAAITAATEGWRVTYLGPSLPTEEIAATALKTGARAVALSLTYPGADPRMERELRDLAAYLPQEVTLLVGGRAVDSYAAALEAAGAIVIQDMPDLRRVLEQLRSLKPDLT